MIESLPVNIQYMQRESLSSQAILWVPHNNKITLAALQTEEMD
jgi:hypothetical protein